jgi:hypothetical protein
LEDYDKETEFEDEISSRIKNQENKPQDLTPISSPVETKTSLQLSTKRQERDRQMLYSKPFSHGSAAVRLVYLFSIDYSKTGFSC